MDSERLYLTASPALRAGPGYASDNPVVLTVTGIGTVSVPSGTLGVGDPGYADPRALLRVPVDPGAYMVMATRFSLPRVDRTRRTYNAAVSVILADRPESIRRPLPVPGGEAEPTDMDTVGVDGGVMAFLDWVAFQQLWERDEAALESFFLDDLAARSMPWDAPLPGRTENVVADQSGYGDGGYPVYGGFADDGGLVAVHVDFNNAALTTTRFRS